ncbi:hypothetical protein OROMI_032927 [Orobanche minor]
MVMWAGVSEEYTSGFSDLAEEITLYFTLNWSKYAEFLTFHGGLDPVEVFG